MEIGIGIWAFVVYIATIIVWMLALKRNVTEGMGVGLIVVALFNGPAQTFQTIVTSVNQAAQETPFLCTMLFLIMATIMTKAGIIARLVELLNSMIGKVKGGAAYVSTCASFLFGLVSGNAVANGATVGAITIPWMKESGWPKEVAATMNAGNAGLGQAMPSCTAMFLLVGMPAVAATMDIGQAYLAVLCGGTWTFVYRLIRVWLYARKYDVQPVPADRIKPIGQSFRDNWTSLLMLVGIAIPLLLTMGPVSEYLKGIKSVGKAGIASINIVLWVPIVICIICILVGWKNLPKTTDGWLEIFRGSQKSICNVGAVLLLAIAASNVLNAVGFDKDLAVVLEALNLPSLLMIILTCIVVILVAGPLSAVATTAAIGAVAFNALVSAGATPLAAIAAFMICISTEGASPPSSAPIFLSCGLAEVEDPQVIFGKLIMHYVLPLLVLGVLVSVGILPVFQ